MKTRRRDIPAMIFGLIFMGISGWYIFDREHGFDLAVIGWITAGLLILLGVAGIASALRNARE
jgi:putative Mn2+ efflux pump MntP